MKHWLFLMFVGLTVLTVRAEDAPDPDREARLKFVKDRFAEWTLSAPVLADSATPTIYTNQLDPLLRYTNPVGGLVQDGTFFVWRDGRRPVAACSFSVRGPQDPPGVWFEMTSLVGFPLHCERDGQARWTPTAAGLVGRPVPGVEAPEDRPVARLTTMRNIARRFEAQDFIRNGASATLRLLPQPIDRFQDEQTGTLDAALFAYAEANDPELLILIEARTAIGQPDPASGGRKPPDVSGAKPQWLYTIARMTSRELRVQLDGTEVFTAPNFWQGPKSLEEPYLEASDGRMVLTTPSPADPQSTPTKP